MDEHEESTFDTTIHVTICIYVDLYIFISYIRAYLLSQYLPTQVIDSYVDSSRYTPGIEQLYAKNLSTNWSICCWYFGRVTTSTGTFHNIIYTTGWFW